MYKSLDAQYIHSAKGIPIYVQCYAGKRFFFTFAMQQQVTVKAHSRMTFVINSFIVPIAQAYNNMGSNSYAVSITVQALGSNAKIVAERPMYFDFYGDPGGTDVLGFTGS